MLILAACIAFISVFTTMAIKIQEMAKNSINEKNIEMTTKKISNAAKTLTMLGEGSSIKYTNIGEAKIIQKGKKCIIETTHNKTKYFELEEINCQNEIETKNKTIIIKKNQGKITIQAK
jgi:hypothetical protein